MPDAPYPHLFQEILLRNLRIPNRTVMAPMSTNLGSQEGFVTPEQVAFYRERASGGTGMIIVEFCCVEGATGRSEHRQLTLESPAQVAGHQRLVEAITSAGSVACLQLQHGGRGAKRDLLADGMPIAPSDVATRSGRLMARGMDDAEVERLVEAFGRAAELGVQAGYQAVELHGAHGYLLTSFLSPYSNQRTDRWGGDEERRLEFPRRVIQRVRQSIGDRPLIFRLSADEFTPDGLSIEDMERIAPKLVSAGVDALHVSIGLGWTSFDKVIEPMSTPEGWRLPYSRRIRAVVDVPVITVGQIRWPETAERAIREGDADMIALGRPLLADPQWANKARLGERDCIRPCTSCNYCVAISSAADGAIGCAENPRTGHELDSLPDAGHLRGQRAVVIGGGPGGMAAALMLQQAGFATELHESRSVLGGGLIASAAPPFKDKLTWYLDYLHRQLEHSDVSVRLDSRIDLVDLDVGEKPAIVMLATGGHPIRMPIDGVDNPIVRDAYDLLMGDSARLPLAVGEKPVLVYGGGETGCETAELLSEQGHEVVLVSRSPAEQLARSAEVIYRGVLKQRLLSNPRIRIQDNASIERIDADGGVLLRHQDGSSSELQTSAVLIAQGRRPDESLLRGLLEVKLPVTVIGDARRGGRIGDAVHDAYRAVHSLCASAAPLRPLAC
ncbi:NADH:flavin oxidoreductase [Pseudomonas aeruginosa]|uniref:oxidoreductase n=1 Tax=Pseudomonas aeruginosa TaxID=287 RepID=UPI00071BF0C1|nr:FAD-dependent oxidoreductase [Pseudomonas aeruginosa]KSQ24997.1 NADH:flavin oxidoreductase [Pseudomonas aeruginosa]MCO1690116.1 NADH:flavin oxidoreductase [Pseudomonas aeruginosa]MCO1780378.1 NADH:flavin oxidoreductase [Pseudomonas aeruginosa]MCO1790136.1 NADH:flavin oxidoreductase [Pseudomonas aeruginosa]MCO1799224.1 NADH:flavin oxidoreductase [Pseudomonas aeruginosa]